MNRALAIVISPLALAAPCAAQPWWWPPTDGLEVAPECPAPSTAVQLTVSGQWPDNCIPNMGQAVRTGNTIDVNVWRDPPPGFCLTVIRPWSMTVDAGLLPAGEYTVYSTYYLNGNPSTTRELMGTFEVDPACGGVPCYANCDSSTTPPILNVQDFGCFLTRYAAGDPYANCDGSTTEPVLNVQDFGCFLTQYAAGCP
ncbi:MAG: GC-type dockerin domain-anchored protein [Phycisphaerales bacterium]